ncbi:hypothetical protein [Desulforamulus aquiferis]|uniref:Uncharacterized protein n=1 Tax=Desulforamulus aquiferis TaxID=1397668 RepID=A0AAW7ZD54_9FIRM|nr:hypothetical protein [Desulforamulus aquiferis]MDO7786981.1 hypothetical protein [Desulforamulus aquiferis]RYD03867.1 hypothetical protein N752_17450 [Desulforamulus aquiferis]
MAKVLKEGTSYNQRDVIDVLVEFSGFKDRVEKKFKEVARELEGKPNEHDLWVNIYLISCDYADDQFTKRKSPEPIQKIS